ncbi:hypothetical protein DPEC_G00178210 [Dallia pectoralis]|uniref:Uncharacterized protein n=1 Tax=Dallia pectoralis TaxID=75939 RepID=A0ACC2GFD9_DALPE|nr:hypothetical protein DPEC_G00178210 [Dallia pectoralis]
MAGNGRVFSTSLTSLPKFTSADVVKSVGIHSSTKGNKLDKGYKLFHEEFIHNYQGCPTRSGLHKWLAKMAQTKNTGPLPDPYMMASGSKLSQVQPRPLMAVVLDGVSEMEQTPSKFVPVPRGSPMSYHCPPKKSSDLILHHMAPEFPSLPLMQHTFPRLHFVPTLHQFMHLQSLEVSPQLSSEIAKETQQQSKCPAWTQLQRPRLTAIRFWDACCSKACREEQESAAIQMIRGSTKQTAAMKRGLLVEPEVLVNYAEVMRVNVLPAGFVIHPDAPRSGV